MKKALAVQPSAAAVRKRLDQLEAELASQQQANDGAAPEPEPPRTDGAQPGGGGRSSARPLHLMWQQPFRDEKDVVSEFLGIVDKLIERSGGLPESLDSRIKRLNAAKSFYERAMQQKDPRTSEFIAPAVNGAESLRRPRMDKTQDYVDRACREMFDFCRRRSRVDLGQRAYKIANEFRPPASKELLDSNKTFASSPKKPPAPPPAPPPPAPPTVSGERLPSDERLLWATARISGIRTVQKYIQENQAIEELMKILTQMNPQESPVVVDLIQQFSQTVAAFSNTPSEVRDSRRFLYDSANGIAKRFDKLFTGAMPQRLADMLTPYHQAVEQVLGDLSKQASIIPTLQASIDNPFISLDAERSTIMLRIKNSSDRPVTDILANLLVETSPVSVIGSRECSIAKLEAQHSQFFNFQVQRNHLSAAGGGVTEAGFSISLKASAEGFEDIDLGIKKQVIKVVRSFSDAIGKDQIPKRFLIGKALDSKTSELFQGRDDDIKKISGSLEEGAQSERYFLDGIRRVGKTSILKMLPSFLPAKIIPVYFNFEDTALGQRGPLESWKILQDFCFKLNDSLPAASLPAVPDSATFQSDPGRTFRSYLDSVKTAVPGRVPLFMFDEFPDLLVAVARSGAGQDRETLVLDQLRGLLDSGDLNAIFTGSMRFDSLSDVLAHRILGSLTPLRVSFLKKESVGQVLRAGMADWITLPPETIDSVFDQSGGYPWFVQIYGAFLVDLMNIERRAIATPGDVAIVTREQILPIASHFEYWWPSQLGSSEERFIERLFREYPDTESVPRDHFFENINFREQGEFKRAFENLRACEVLDSDKADVLRIRGAALRQWLKTRTFDGRLRIERSQSSKKEALSQVGIFIDHENLIKALENVAKAHGLQVPFGQEKVAWLSSILKHMVDEATRRVGNPTCRVAVAFWDRTNESRLQTAYHHHDFQLKQPEEIKMENAVDFKLVTEVHRAQQQATKEGERLEQVIIVSGDGDYAHLARALKNEGVNIQIWAGSKSVNSGYREIIGRENVLLLDDVCGL
ncbi:MAG: NYN domain-containing protein [Bryobacteraceae bacterium]